MTKRRRNRKPLVFKPIRDGRCPLLELLIDALPDDEAAWFVDDCRTSASFAREHADIWFAIAANYLERLTSKVPDASDALRSSFLARRLSGVVIEDYLDTDVTIHERWGDRRRRLHRAAQVREDAEYDRQMEVLVDMHELTPDELNVVRGLSSDWGGRGNALLYVARNVHRGDPCETKT